jgi:hypothetical protein
MTGEYATSGIKSQGYEIGVDEICVFQNRIRVFILAAKSALSSAAPYITKQPAKRVGRWAVGTGEFFHFQEPRETVRVVDMR